MDGVIPLLDDNNTFLLTHGGKVVWTGKNETCNHLACPTLDNVYCRCFTCNSSFWASYTTLFCGDMISGLDLDSELVPESDNLFSDPTTHSDPVPVNPLSDPKVQSDFVSLPDHNLSDTSVHDITPKSEFVPLPGHTLNSSTSSTIKSDTPQSNSSRHPTFSASSIINVNEVSFAG